MFFESLPENSPSSAPCSAPEGLLLQNDPLPEIADHDRAIRQTRLIPINEIRLSASLPTTAFVGTQHQYRAIEQQIFSKAAVRCGPREVASHDVRRRSQETKKEITRREIGVQFRPDASAVNQPGNAGQLTARGWPCIFSCYGNEGPCALPNSCRKTLMSNPTPKEMPPFTWVAVLMVGAALPDPPGK